MPDMIPDSNLTDYRLAMIERTLESMADNIKALTTLEQKHLETRESLNRCFAMIEQVEHRTRSIELELQTLKMVRSWIIAGVLGVMGILGTSLVRLITG